MIHSGICGKRKAFNVPAVGSKVSQGKKVPSQTITARLKSGSEMISSISDPWLPCGSVKSCFLKPVHNRDD